MHPCSAGGATEAHDSEAWPRWDAPDGRYALRRPPGWPVQYDGVARIVVSSPEGQGVALWRRCALAPGSGAGDWLAHEFARHEPGLHAVRLCWLQERGDDVVLAAFDYGGRVFAGRAGVLLVRDGASALLYIAAAAHDRFTACRPRLVRILCSLQPRPEAAAGLDLAGLLLPQGGPTEGRP